MRNESRTPGRLFRLAASAVALLLVSPAIVGGVAQADTKFYLPFPEGVSYNINATHHNGDNHIPPYNQDAVDFHMPENSIVAASAGGTVNFAGYMDPLTGIVVLIDHGNNRCSQYAHLNEVRVKEDQKVSQGETIALSGGTGAGENNFHLHWNMVLCSDRVTSKEVIKTVELGTTYTKDTMAKSQNAIKKEQDREVTPKSVSFADESGTANDTYTIPAVDGVDYLIDDKVVAAGQYPGSGKVTVTAKPQDGFKFPDGATTKWTNIFDDTEPNTPKPTLTATQSPRPTMTATQSPRPTMTATRSATAKPTPTVTSTATATATVTRRPVGPPKTGW